MLTFVIAVYGQPLMLEQWWKTLRAYDDEVLDNLHLVIVDDHGDPPAAIPVDIQAMLDCRLYRVTKQIEWNQMGARNLGVQEAQTSWVLMMDPDMVVEPVMAKKLLGMTKKMLFDGQVCKLLLRYTDDVLDATSPNVYLMTKTDFYRAGGYDEDYAGHKGWSDVQFMHTLRGLRMRFHRPDGLWVRYYRPRDIADATVNTLDRSVKHNRSLHLRKMRAIQAMGWKRWAAENSKKLIRFPWERLL